MNVGKTLYRYHNFDLLRSVAMFLGIVIHSPLIFVDKSVGKEVLPEIDYLPEIEPWIGVILLWINSWSCLLYTSPSPRDRTRSRMPSSA